jgi:hypothetical protein
VSLCLDPVAQEDQHCPDFKHIEVALYKAGSWSEDYEESHTPQVITLAGQTVALDIDGEGDEAINRELFEFLRALLRAPDAEAAVLAATGCPARLGVQLLDSAFNDSWSPAAERG